MKTNSGEIGYFPLILIALLISLMFEASGYTHFLNDIQGFLK